MDEYRKSSDAVMAARSRLASSVASILKDAGIPVMLGQGQAHFGTAIVEVDQGDDAAGGVYVSWQPSALLIERNNGHLLAGEHDHVDIGFSGQVCASMMEAMLTILRHRGVNATVEDDDLRPYTICLPVHGSHLSRYG